MQNFELIQIIELWYYIGYTWVAPWLYAMCDLALSALVNGVVTTSSDNVCLQKYKMAAKINLKPDKIVMVITVAMFLWN